MKKTLVEQLVWNNLLSSGDHKLTLFNKIDLSMYSSYPWVLVLQRIGEKKGVDYLFNLGYMMGECAVNELLQVMKSSSRLIHKDIKSIESFIEMTGFGMVEVDEKKVKVIFNNIIVFGYERHGESSLINHFYAGVYSAFIEKYLKKRCRLRERSGYKEFQKDKNTVCVYTR